MLHGTEIWLPRPSRVIVHELAVLAIIQTIR